MPEAPIRRATAADGAACAAIVDAWLTGLDWMTERPSLTALEMALSEGLPKREAYVIGDPVQGYLAMDPAEAHIHGIYVKDQGAGLGQRLMDTAKTDRTFLQLHTHAANIRAHRFYQREGFVQDGEAFEGSDGLDQIRMVWRA